MAGPIATDVLAFIDENIDTVPHLEALLLLWRSAPAEWEAQQIAARIYVSPTKARAILDDLVRRELLSPANATQSRYVFSPAGPTALLVPKVAEAYDRNLVGVSTLIHSKGSMSVREFARAFHLKGEDRK